VASVPSVVSVHLYAEISGRVDCSLGLAAKEGGDTLGISPLFMNWMGSFLLLLPVIVILVSGLNLALLLHYVIDSLG